MATTQAPLTPTTNTAPAVANVPTNELSGAPWVARFPGRSSIDYCVEPFKSALASFVAALKAAGATVTISATFRPLQRAYLMHWCYMIVNDDQDPRTVPAMNGVLIKWDHTAVDGTYSQSASVAAAQAMINGYGMQNLNTAPALFSQHTAGLAVDMNISWSGDLFINKADGIAITITSTPKTGMNSDLAIVGASYGVIKFVGGATDKPHWSSNGH